MGVVEGLVDSLFVEVHRFDVVVTVKVMIEQVMGFVLRMSYVCPVLVLLVEIVVNLVVTDLVWSTLIRHVLDVAQIALVASLSMVIGMWRSPVLGLVAMSLVVTVIEMLAVEMLLFGVLV